MDGGLLDLLAGTGRERIDFCGAELELRLLSARGLLEARREAKELFPEDREAGALCVNACILARGLYCGGQQLYVGGREVLERLSPEQIARLMERFLQLKRRDDPSATEGEERIQSLKKAWSTHPTNA